MTDTARRTSGLVVPRFRPDAEGTHPPLDYAGYKSTALRHPSRPLVPLPQMLTETTAPGLRRGPRRRAADADLTRQHEGEPQGERIIVYGQVLEDDRRPVPNTLVEVWQANAAGRYRHAGDQHPAPLDPNFSGGGRCLTDAEGRFRFVTIKPGAYPWGNHHNAWRPAHIHFSVFGRAFLQRLVTQMYFPGDPLFFQDPIFNSVRDPAARERMICRFDLEQTAARVGAGLPVRHRPARGRGDADGGPLRWPRRRRRRSGRSSPSGCPSATGPTSCAEGTRGRGLAARQGVRRRRRPGARRARGDLAGRPRRARSAAPSAASGAARTDDDGRWAILTLKPGRRSDGRRRPTSTCRLRARAAAPGRHAHLLRRRGGRPTPPTRCSPAWTSTPRATLVAQRRRRRLRARHPPPGAP